VPSPLLLEGKYLESDEDRFDSFLQLANENSLQTQE